MRSINDMRLFISAIGVLLSASLAFSQSKTPEVLKGKSEFQTSRTDSCSLQISRDSTGAVIKINLQAPVRVWKKDENLGPQVVEKFKGINLNDEKTFQSFNFLKQKDIEGDGFMLVGERQKLKDEKEKVFIHFELSSEKINKIQFAYSSKSVKLGKSASFDQSCSFQR